MTTPPAGVEVLRAAGLAVNVNVTCSPGSAGFDEELTPTMVLAGVMVSVPGTNVVT
jgi:hypothetical protein